MSLVANAANAQVLRAAIPSRYLRARKLPPK
jgi:hypothetical protein